MRNPPLGIKREVKPILVPYLLYKYWKSPSGNCLIGLICTNRKSEVGSCYS